MVSPRTALALTPALIVALALSAAPASAAAPPGDSRSAVSYTARSQQSTFKTTALRATNAARVERHLLALDADECLLRFAVQQASAMAAAESMYHQDLVPVLRTCGLGLVGENVAVGSDNGRDVVQAWMASPGHRANILNRGFRVVAVAARQSAGGRWYSAQVFGRR
jgi:uncharacterized protein YkwD